MLTDKRLLSMEKPKSLREINRSEQGHSVQIEDTQQELMLEKLWYNKEMQIQHKFTKLYGFYRGKYISKLHMQVKEWVFSFISWTLPWSFLSQCLEAIDKLEGLHRNVHELSNVLQQLI